METGKMEYIESYFQQTMAGDERLVFEEKIGTDKDFANDVAFYIGARQTLKQQLLHQKQAEWTADDNRKELLPSIAPVKKLPISKWFSYVAAACVLLFAGFYFFEKRSETPQQLAGNYIAKNIAPISLTMDGGAKNDIELGKIEFSNKNYDKALQYFENAKKIDPTNSDVKLLLGNVYLVTNNYDKALQQYDELANVKDLKINNGLFYKAVTLMQRNKDGDIAEAKQLLQQVVKENLGHHGDAAEWLKKF